MVDVGPFLQLNSFVEQLTLESITFEDVVMPGVVDMAEVNDIPEVVDMPGVVDMAKVNDIPMVFDMPGVVDMPRVADIVTQCNHFEESVNLYLVETACDNRNHN